MTEVALRKLHHPWGHDPYTAGDFSAFHQALKQLPSNYYHNKAFRSIYEKQGVLALIEATKDQAIDRMSDKTWNSDNSPLNGFFLWCASKGDALPKGTASICKDEFVHIPKRRRKRSDDSGRRIYEAAEEIKLFSAPKFVGCKSTRNW